MAPLGDPLLQLVARELASDDRRRDVVAPLVGERLRVRTDGGWLGHCHRPEGLLQPVVEVDQVLRPERRPVRSGISPSTTGSSSLIT